jgi:hypothetical protein
MLPTLRDASLRDAPQGEACVFSGDAHSAGVRHQAIGEHT